MKILPFILLLFVFTACNNGDGGSPTAPTPPSPPTAPSISNIRTDPASPFARNSGNGAQGMTLYIDYSDPNGDIDKYTTTVSKQDANGQPITKTETFSFNGALSSKTSGTKGWLKGIDTTYPHTTEVSYFFTDTAGQNSNTLTITLTVL